MKIPKAERHTKVAIRIENSVFVKTKNSIIALLPPHFATYYWLNLFFLKLNEKNIEKNIELIGIYFGHFYMVG